MPNYSKKIIYLSQAQYQELVTNRTITVNGTTITYNEDDLYVTPQSNPVTDVQIGGTSILQNGVANVPIATDSLAGVVKVGSNGVGINNGTLFIQIATESIAKPGTSTTRSIVPATQHAAAFYGLAKAAGADMASSANAVGTYTDDAKGAIQSMLGVSGLMAPDESSLTASKSYAIGDVFLVKGALYKATAAIVQGTSIVTTGVNANCEATNVATELENAGSVSDVQINGTSILQNGVANIPMSAAGVLGVVQPGNGLNVSFDGTIAVSPAAPSAIKSGDTTTNRPITPGYQHAAVFYGLAKAAGDATQKKSSNAVGTYTDDAKAAIRTMLGVTDPTTTLAGLTDTNISSPQTNQFLQYKNGAWKNVTYTPPTPSVSKAFNEWTDTNNDVGLGAGKVYLCLGPAGEWPTDYLTLRNAVATNVCALYDSDYDFIPYTSFSEDYINGAYTYTIIFGDRVYKSEPTEGYMYRYATISPSSSNGGYVVDISSTAPSIVGEANHRYNCGEVTTISITPPAAGTIDVLFESGSTAAALTVPNTVKWPGWFDPDDLDTDTIYEILIVDGVYGSVMTWNA